MNIKSVVLIQYQNIVDLAARQVERLTMPKEGWLRTVRKSLGMSGAQLARRMDVSRSLISNTEKAELSGSVTLKTMQQMAEALDCRFVYAIVPNVSVDKILKERAIEKAKAYVEKTNTNMALEGQTLSENQVQFEIDRLAQSILKDNLSDLWNDQ